MCTRATAFGELLEEPSDRFEGSELSRRPLDGLQAKAADAVERPPVDGGDGHLVASGVRRKVLRNVPQPDKTLVKQRRFWIVFVVSIVAAAIVSRLMGEPDEEQTVKLGDIAFATTMLFNTLAMLTIAVLIGLYIWLW